MGSTGIYKYDCIINRRGNVDRKATLDHEFTCSYHGIVRSTMVGTEYYGILWYEREDNVRRYVGVCARTWMEDGMFWFKEMDETVGPYLDRCPQGILNELEVLNPLNDENDPHFYARMWREKCRNYNAEQKNPVLYKNVKKGGSIVWRIPDGRGINYMGTPLGGTTVTLTKRADIPRKWYCPEIGCTVKTSMVDAKDCELA